MGPRPSMSCQPCFQRSDVRQVTANPSEDRPVRAGDLQMPHVWALRWILKCKGEIWNSLGRALDSMKMVTAVPGYWGFRTWQARRTKCVSINRCTRTGKESIYRVQYDPGFQAPTGSLEAYPQGEEGTTVHGPCLFPGTLTSEAANLKIALHDGSPQRNAGSRYPKCFLVLFWKQWHFLSSAARKTHLCLLGSLSSIYVRVVIVRDWVGASTWTGASIFTDTHQKGPRHKTNILTPHTVHVHVAQTKSALPAGE